RRSPRAPAPPAPGGAGWDRRRPRVRCGSFSIALHHHVRGRPSFVGTGSFRDVSTPDKVKIGLCGTVSEGLSPPSGTPPLESPPVPCIERAFSVVASAAAVLSENFGAWGPPMP